MSNATMYETCMKRVFRSDGDSEEKRLCDTPLPNVILSKLDTFTIKWKDSADDKGINALKNIKRHISAGCLSGIPPGGGTNRNESIL